MRKDIKETKYLRIALFGIRSIPPTEGSAGADTCALELCRRFALHGHNIVAYNRVYNSIKENRPAEYNGIKLIHIKTINKAGFDSLIHSFKSTLHIIFHNTADIVNIANGGNSIWGILLKLFGKRIFVGQDGIDWKREKWPWYGKVFLYFSAFITANVPHAVIFDNIFTKELFEKKFKKKFYYIPNGSNFNEFVENDHILKRMNLEPQEYILFVGRFIPDKGIHYLISAFEKIETSKKLVLVGGSPNPSDYEKTLLNTSDKRIIFPGYVYGNDVLNLMRKSYLYIQPSDIEGLSPVILTVLNLGIPLLCSNIRENLFIVENDALTFEKSNVESLKEKIEYALKNSEHLMSIATKAKARIERDYDWDKIAIQYIELFKNYSK